MKSITFILFHICVFILQIIVFILIFSTKDILNNNIVFISKLFENWSKSPINKIQLEDFICPINFDTILINKQYIDCEANEENYFLKRYNERENVFKNFKKQIFCFQTLQDFSYFEYKRTKKCHKTEKDCGYLDTLKNKLCVQNKTSCPINSLHIKHHNHSIHLDTNYKKVNSTMTSLIIDKNYSLEITNSNSDSSLLVDIDIIQGIIELIYRE